MSPHELGENFYRSGTPGPLSRDGSLTPLPAQASPTSEGLGPDVHVGRVAPVGNDPAVTAATTKMHPCVDAQPRRGSDTAQGTMLTDAHTRNASSSPVGSEHGERVQAGDAPQRLAPKADPTLLDARIGAFRGLSPREQIIQAAGETDPELANRFRLEAARGILDGSNDTRSGVEIIGYGPRTEGGLSMWNPISSRYKLEVVVTDQERGRTSITVDGPAFLEGISSDQWPKEAGRLNRIIEDYGELRTVNDYMQGDRRVVQGSATAGSDSGDV